MEESGKVQERLVQGESIAAIRQHFNYLVELLTYGEMREDEFLRAIEDFLWVDTGGTPWIISLENGNWYRLVGEDRVLGEPPDVLYCPVGSQETRDEPASKFCAYCGKPLSEGKKFCSGCGKPA